MAWWEMALMAILLILLILFLPLGPIWFIPVLILFGIMIAIVRHREKTKEEEPPLPLRNRAPALHAPVRAVDVLARAWGLVTAIFAPGRNMIREPESSSTSLSSSRIEYDVFLNFRGSNTRYSFVDYLYHMLVDVGITVFIDDGPLRAGEEIMPELIEGIKRSSISIAIFSKDYASSKSCLMEMVQMWQCRELYGQIIIPIFYDVSPVDVKHQAGEFGRSFNLHRIDEVDSKTIETWREVLRKIGTLHGYVRENIHGGHEGKLLDTVVERVVQVLRKDDQVVTNNLVGIDHHVEKMMGKLGVAYREGQAVEVPGEEVGVVKIWGVPGVGKTTLAKVVYNKMHKLFDASSFLEDISSQGVSISQQRLIADLQKRKYAPLESIHEGIENIASSFSNMKVLIVLDDVDEDEQIRVLTGNLSRFAPGSRIIVTTKKGEVLNAVDGQAVEAYKLEPLRGDGALQLFRKHAFGGEASEGASECDSLSEDIVKEIGGLPSDIKNQASFLRNNMNIDTWKTTLKLLRENPKNRQAAFRVSRAGGSDLETIEDNPLTNPIQDFGKQTE